MNSKINIDKFICDFLNGMGDNYIFEEESFIHYALKQQGLVYKNGEIVELDQKPLTEEQKPVTTPGSYDMKLVCLPDKPQTIKFNKERLMEIAKPESIEEKYNINIEKMVEEYKERILISRSLRYDDLLVRAIAYKQGLKDMLKLIKEGGSNESID